MTNYVYETHPMPNPLLPFIFHPRFVVTQRQSLPNWHENIEILHCTGGNGFVQCGIESFPFCQGDIFIVNANTPHSIYSETSVSYRCLIVDNSFCIANGIPILQLHFQQVIRDSQMTRLIERAADAFVRYSSKSPLTVTAIRCAVLELLLFLCENYSVPKPKDGTLATNTHIKKAMDYIRSHIATSISLDAVAGYVGISKYHLSREFKAFTGKTIVQTTNLLRCIEAKRLIESGASIHVAAASCGFENLSYFTKTFQKIYGQLPSAVPKKEHTSLDTLEDRCY